MPVSRPLTALAVVSVVFLAGCATAPTVQDTRPAITDEQLQRVTTGLVAVDPAFAKADIEESSRDFCDGMMVNSWGQPELKANVGPEFGVTLSDAQQQDAIGVILDYYCHF